MRRVLLDSNALDPLTYVPGAFELLRDAVESGGLDILFTHVTIDEMAATPDLDKRQWLLVLLFALGRMIDTSGAIVDFSRVDFCRVMDDDDESIDILPDLVVHGRGDDDRNILVMEWKKNARNSTLARLRSRVEQLLISDASHSGYSYKIGVLVDVRTERIKWRAVEIGQTDDTWTTIPVPNSASGQ